MAAELKSVSFKTSQLLQKETKKVNNDSEGTINDNVKKKKNVPTDGETEKTIGKINKKDEQYNIITQKNLFENKGGIAEDEVAADEVTKEDIVECTPDEEILENNIEEKTGSSVTTQFHTENRNILNHI